MRALSKTLPAVSLFLGPSSVGKWELAEWLRVKHGFLASDVLRIKRLTQDNAKFVARFAVGSPQGSHRLVIIRLEKATSTALNTLLKTLEEPGTTKFILVTTQKPIATIVSRCSVFEFGLLTDAQVSGILISVKGFGESLAVERASKAGGRVRPALSQGFRQDQKALVLRALEALASKDAKTLDSLAPKWLEEHTQLLVAWCYESITGRWKLFIEDETSIRGAAIPLKILVALREELRPRLVVRAALASVL